MSVKNVVADSNVFLAVALDEPEKSRIVGLTGNADLIAPEFLYYEIGNALTALGKRRRLREDEAAAHDAIVQIPVRLLAVEVRRVLPLAFRFGLADSNFKGPLCQSGPLSGGGAIIASAAGTRGARSESTPADAATVAWRTAAGNRA